MAGTKITLNNYNKPLQDGHLTRRTTLSDRNLYKKTFLLVPIGVYFKRLYCNLYPVSCFPTTLILCLNSLVYFASFPFLAILVLKLLDRIKKNIFFSQETINLIHLELKSHGVQLDTRETLSFKVFSTFA